MVLYKYLVIGSLRKMMVGGLFLPVILMICPEVFSQPYPGTPAMLQGIITNGVSGLSLVGAKVTVNGKSALSTSLGIYSLVIEPVGTFPVSAAKAGFDNFTSTPVAFQPGVTSMMNIQLWESLNAPANVSVLLDTVNQLVPVNWDPPSGEYELLYDDGIQDNFAIWSSQGNMNAVKYNPAGFPVKVTGGSIHIGAGVNYPSGSNPFVNFQVRIFDATGAGGTPGNSIGGPYSVTPSALGWVEFSFSSPVIINSGAFFIAMVQGGNAPNAAGIAIDETMPQFRSYSRYVSGGGAWYPAGGNFMIRARCEGPGGPVSLDNAPASSGIYNIYRLRQGEEQNPSAWTMIGSTAATSITDSSWLSLPCGPYRWGVKTQYPGNRWSPAEYSNILGKCWTVSVNIHLALSCDSIDPSGTYLHLVNLAYPDTIYAAVTDSTGSISFPNVWKGSYQLTVRRFGYDTLSQFVPVAAPVSLDLFLLQKKIPPANLVVNDSSLMSRWDVPRFEKKIFTEQWSNGSFTANSWTVEGGNNWGISQTFGTPAPSAVFIGVPHQLNYSQSLISRTISGQNSTSLKLRYDIYLDNLSNTTVNQMAVEIWDGSAWNTLKNYSNAAGNIPWTNEALDISGYTNQTFRIRFRAYGGDSYDINYWSIDNIDLVASEPAQQLADCILGYYFYLGDVISGYTTQNAYKIPGNQVEFGHTYNACVRALYGSGYSEFACTTFTSHFLYPVRNLDGYPVEDVAYISWEKPMTDVKSISGTPPGLIGYNIYRDGVVIETINDTATLSFYDYGLEPGYYQYGVSARYNLSVYGFPGQTGESIQAGPLLVTISWGHPLPFFESWSVGTFAFNDWRFNPLQGNWIVNTEEGVPSPSANFKWAPPLVNYNISLESPPLNGLPCNCATVWLDFDLKLDDRNYTGTEKMIVEIYYNNAWNFKTEIKNTGSIPWNNYHLDISQVRGKGFRVRFRAFGQNSSEILNWFIDNINIYPVCFPATNLTGQAVGNSVLLTWGPPACYGGGLLSEGFEESFFPPLQWSVQTSNPSSTWSHISETSPLGVHSGSFSAGLDWDYNHQDEWIIAHNVYVNGNLTFWSYAFQGSLHQDHYYVKVSSDQGTTWNTVLDMSAMPPYPGPTGVNAWITPYHVNLYMFMGQTVDIAWNAVDGDGNGLWYPWAIDDCSIGADDDNAAVGSINSAKFVPDSIHGSPRELIGYDIYRNDPGSAGYARINMDIVADTVWIDEGLPLGQYRYFILARFNECENVQHSDTVLVDVITGLEALHQSGISIFPNPVTDHFTVKSPDKIMEIRLYEASGKIAGDWFPVERDMITIGTSGLTNGMYLLQVSTGREVKHFKICVQ